MQLTLGSRRWRRRRRTGAGPRAIFVGGVAALVAMGALVGNWVYQVIHKPTELFFPISESLFKTPSETWRSYAPLFRTYATGTLTPAFLAALAQAEAAGNPVARTYWRWGWSLDPLKVYRPASTSVGMYQMTDAAFAQASHYCIQDHVAVHAGDPGVHCRSDGFYSRVLPGDAIELTAVLLDVQVAATLSRRRIRAASLRQKQHLAALIHLCGAATGDAYVRRGFQMPVDERCGEHNAPHYLARIDSLLAQFAVLAARDYRQ